MHVREDVREGMCVVTTLPWPYGGCGHKSRETLGSNAVSHEIQA